MKNDDKYVTVKIPKDLASIIDNYIENSNLGYRNRTEYIVTIIREKINIISK